MGAPQVLLVDDEPGILHSLRRVLRREAFDLATTDSPGEALRRLESGSVAVVVADERMPAMSGIELLERSRALSPDTVRVMLSGCVDAQSLIEAINRGGVHSFVTKPWDDQSLRRVLRHAVSQYRAAADSRRLHALTQWQNAALQATNRELSQARRQEAEVATQIRRALLTSRPAHEVERLRAAALAVPSRRVDGAFHEVLAFDHCLDVVMGDVMGKGVPAALLGAATRVHLLRALSHLGLRSSCLPRPADIVTRVNAEVADELVGLDSPVALCYARFDAPAGTAALINCGHVSPVHFRAATGACTLLAGGHMPLGLTQREAYQETVVAMEPGDIFLFHSSGVTDVQGACGEPFGEHRLLELVKQQAAREPQALLEGIQRSLTSHARTPHPGDDVTCVAVRLAD